MSFKKSLLNDNLITICFLIKFYQLYVDSKNSKIFISTRVSTKILKNFLKDYKILKNFVNLKSSRILLKVMKFLKELIVCF